MTLTSRRLTSALAAFLLLAPAAAFAQDSKSAASVTELVKALDAMKLDAYAVKGSAPNEYVGALYFPGTQLLVVSAKFDTPYRADSLLTMKNYKDLYIELTTLKQSLVTKKNRKLRRLRELYPDVKIKLLYNRDYRNLVLKYGLAAATKRQAAEGPAAEGPAAEGPAAEAALPSPPASPPLPSASAAGSLAPPERTP